MSRTLKNDEIGKYVLPVVRLALSEDIGSGDVTSLFTVFADTMAEAEIVSKADGVVAGLFVQELNLTHGIAGPIRHLYDAARQNIGGDNVAAAG